MSPAVRKGVAAALLVLWGASLLSPTLRSGGSDWGPGWFILLMGWMGLFEGIFAWFANPLFIVATILLFRGRGAPWLRAACGVLMLLLCLQMGFTTALVDNEGGITRPINERFIGYWLWMAAIGLGGAVSLVSAINPRSIGFGDAGEQAPA